MTMKSIKRLSSRLSCWLPVPMAGSPQRWREPTREDHVEALLVDIRKPRNNNDVHVEALELVGLLAALPNGRDIQELKEQSLKCMEALVQIELQEALANDRVIRELGAHTEVREKALELVGKVHAEARGLELLEALADGA